MKELVWQPILEEGEAWRFGVDPRGKYLQKTPDGVPVLWSTLYASDEVVGHIGFRNWEERNKALYGE